MVIEKNMTFNITFYCCQLDVCTSCRLLFDCMNSDALKNVTSIFLKKALQLEMFCSTVSLKLNMLIWIQRSHTGESRSLQGADSILIHCHHVSLELKTEEAYTVISSGITEPSVCVSCYTMAHFFPSI